MSELVPNGQSLSASETGMTVREWNDTHRYFPTDRWIHQLFEGQAAIAPEHIAVQLEHKTLTYQELNARANVLAHRLLSSGISTNCPVAICVERSLEMIVGLVGIMKAGAAYVPIDPEAPTDRINTMVRDSGATIVLIQEKFRDRVQVKSEIMIVDAPEVSQSYASDQNPSVAISGNDAAYMIFTSGSTGRPKLAINTHIGILNRLLWMQDTYRLTPADRVLHKTPFTFDVSVWEFFWPLMVGARIVVARPNGHKDPVYLSRAINEYQIGTIHFVPSMLAGFLELGDMALCGSLKRVICSGEALSKNLMDRFFSSSSAELHNLYGPTEAAVDVTFFPCKVNDDHDGAFVPIGRPIANTQIYILDPDLNPMPVGTAGELHIGGVQVGRGYRNQDELTKEKFIPDPFSQAPNARLYRTGDSARWLPDGNIEFLGRMDYQVKIRGVRIEPSEIEAAMLAHPHIDQVVVQAAHNHLNENELIAYLVCRSQQIPSVFEIRSFLEQRLPDVMVPTHYVYLDELPLNSNGKIDRKQLPLPDRSKLNLEYTAPSTAPQRELTSIWTELLDVSPIGIHNNFFVLGGHSLLAARMVQRIEQTFAVAIPLSSVYDYPTIAELASTITSAKNNQSHEPVMEGLLAEIENMSPDDIECAFARLDG